MSDTPGEFGRQRIVFFGSGEFAVPTLERLAASPWRPVLVVTTPDALVGRGLAPRPPLVAAAAGELGISVLQPNQLLPFSIQLSAGNPVDLFIVAAYGKILPKALISIPKRGALVVHPSLLPRWRGPSPVQYSILNGDAETGVTIFLMDEQVDHGPIVRSSKSEIRNPNITTPELTEQLAIAGAALLLETIPEWLADRITPEPQDESQATSSKLLKKEDGHINWSRPAEEIERMTRAFQPWPGTYTFWRRGGDQVRLAVEEAAVMPSMPLGREPAGSVRETETGMAVGTGQGVLLIRRLRREGGRSMPASEFLRGHRDIVGATLGPKHP